MSLVLGFNRKCLKKAFTYFVLFFLLNTINLFAQQTNNLQIIWSKTSPESVFGFGRCISGGDVNGDGYSDIMIVGDSVIDLNSTDSAYRGKCWIFLGGVNFDTIPDVILLNIQRTIFTTLLSTDINGDGYGDVIIGSEYNVGQYGQVLIYLGGNPMDSACDYKITGPFGGSQFGLAISSGDVNGDGFSDLIVGAYGDAVPPVGYFAGKVYIYFGGPNFDTIPDVILKGGHNNDQEGFGSDIGQCADVNDDGYDDIVIGAWDFGTGQGRLYIYLGGNPMDSIADITMIGQGPNQHLGWNAISSLRNANGFAYATIGTRFWPQGFPVIGRGIIHILYGGNPMDSVPDILIVGRTTSAGLASTLSRSGYIREILSDGIMSGAPNDPSSSYGSDYIWLGEPNLDTIPDAWLRASQPNDGLGGNIVSAGDVNCDGRDEIIASKLAGADLFGKVLVCKYTGQGIQDNYESHSICNIPLKINPNPTTRNAAICYSLTSNSKVTIQIYNILGKVVRTFSNVHSLLKAGQHEIRWDLKDNRGMKLAAGIYFVRLIAEQENNKINRIGTITIIK
jgi:hypothetical protein